MNKLMVTMFAFGVFGVSACGVDATGDQSEQQALQSGQQVPDEDLATPNPDYATSDKARFAAEAALPPNAGCGTAGPNLQNQVIADAASPSGGANQRSGSSTGCPAVGVLQPTDDARYFCWTVGNDGFTWTYAQNQRTGVRGWTRDNLLRNNGSNAFCGF